MAARRKKSLMQGSAKFRTGGEAVVYHREHRSKKNRRRIDWTAKDFKYKKQQLILEDYGRDS